jgi:hypothetical protein
MIGTERIAAAREDIHHEITEEHGGDPKSWTAAQGIAPDDLYLWAKDEIAFATAHGAYLSPVDALTIGIQIGLRLGRTAESS